MTLHQNLMRADEAMKQAEAMCEGEFYNVPLITERLALCTTLTRNKANKELRPAVVELVATLLQDYEEVT